MKRWTFYALFLFPCFVQAQTFKLVVKALTPRLVVPIGHTKSTTAVFSPDGKTMLTGCGDKTAKLWDLSGRELQTFSGHAADVISVAFSPDGKLVLTGSIDNTAKLWDFSGQVLQTFSGHTSYVISVAFSPDGKQVLTGSSDSTARLWDLTGRVLQTFSGHDADIISVAFSPDGKQVLTGSSDKTAKLWDLSGRVLKTFSGHTSVVMSAAFSPDGKQIVTCSSDSTAKLWGLSGRVLQTFSGHDATVGSVTFSPDGKQVLTGSDDYTAKLWDLSGRVLQTFYGHADIVISVDFSPDGKQVLTGSGDTTAKLWDLSGQVLQTFSGHAVFALSVAFSPDGKQILMGSVDGSAKLWDLPSRKLQAFTGHTSYTRSAAFSPDGKQVLTGSSDSTARLWDLTGRILQTFPHKGSVLSVAFSPNGKQVLTSSRDSTTKLWDLSGRVLQTFSGYTSRVWGATFSPDGKQILTSSNDYTAKLWDLSGQTFQTFPHKRSVSSVALSPDGKTVLTCSSDGMARLWDLSGRVLQTFTGHTDEVLSAAFSPDGKLVVTGSHDYTAKLWDLSGRVLQTFSGHTAYLISAVFTPDGKKILTSSDDCTTKLWDVKSGKLLATLIAIDSNDWVVTTPSGLFDASEGAKKLMYYVVDYEKEKIILSLEQLQIRYWQPGLLGSIIGLSPYPVKNVGVFDNLKLFPSIEDSTRIESNQLYIKLRERNGGLGKLSLIINGRRLENDLNPLPNRKKDLIVDLKPYIKSRHLRTDTLNTIELEVYESKDELKSEPYKLYYQASVNKRGDGTEEDESISNTCDAPRSLYLIVVGTSLYPQGVDSLPSANEDAVEMARVLSESGKLLYGDRVHLKLLSTKAGESPSKANIAAAFEAFKTANVCDVLVVFFAGHGSNWGKDGDKSNFYYLTQDITFGKLNDEGIRKAFAISDQELTEWMTKIPALNQLLILDACNSGQAAINMGGIVARDVDPDKIIAFNEMSGNTGSYVISGSSASGASFESEVFGHGLLTYSLLEGINGTELVDVLPLLLKSYKRVGELAQSLGKEQTPIIAKPRGNASFFVGKKVKVELPETKPMVIRSFLFDQNAFVDQLEVTNELNRLYRSKVIKGKQAPWFYSDIPEHPQGFSVRGTYTVQPDKSVTVRGSLTRGEMPIGKPFEVSGAPNAKVLADLIFKAVRAGIKLN